MKPKYYLVSYFYADALGTGFGRQLCQVTAPDIDISLFEKTQCEANNLTNVVVLSVTRVSKYTFQAGVK